ncbi:MurR/RpiR family transcriptional regulator [Desulfamplus magnetovallimortis]|nr:MurR/RpiR family transcriptional regulator [Desulfamplus magnetovallimortis]
MNDFISSGSNCNNPSRESASFFSDKEGADALASKVVLSEELDAEPPVAGSKSAFPDSERENSFQDSSHPAIRNIMGRMDELTPKAKILGKYIVQNPGKVVLMTTKQLAEACGTSEATVVRFANGVGYKGYGDLQQSLKDFVSTGVNLPDRSDMEKMRQEPGIDRLHRVVFEELSELRLLYEMIDVNIMNDFVSQMIASHDIYIVGSRISYAFAYYMGWAMTKVRKGISILKGSDSTAIDTLSNAPDDSLVVLVATTRYPNELIKISKLTRRLGHKLLVITDSSTSPVIQFADLALVVPLKSVPFIGTPSNMLCVIKYIVQEVAAGQGEMLKIHQERVEQIYLENDLLFNIRSW